MSKKRLDVLLVERGLVDSRARGQRLIMAGEVRVDGQTVDRPGTAVPATAELTLIQKPAYASRGGEKLAAALDRFQLDITGLVAADVGACTGGFTDVLLQRGAARVYAIDVGYGQLDERLRRDARVVVMERTNARYLELLPEPVSLVTIDVSFISLTLILPAVLGWLTGEGQIVALIKPQFEAGPEQVGKGGVVKDPAVHRAVLQTVLGWAVDHGLAVCDLMASPLLGPAGNAEFLAWLRPGAPGLPRVGISRTAASTLTPSPSPISTTGEGSTFSPSRTDPASRPDASARTGEAKESSGLLRGEGLNLCTDLTPMINHALEEIPADR